MRINNGNRLSEGLWMKEHNLLNTSIMLEAIPWAHSEVCLLYIFLYMVFLNDSGALFFICYTCLLDQQINFVTTLFLSLSNCLTGKENDQFGCHGKILSSKILTWLYLREQRKHFITLMRVSRMRWRNRMTRRLRSRLPLSVSDYSSIRRLMEARWVTDRTSWG